MNRPELKQGDYDNADVRLLQRMLRDLNYLTDTPDGDFGPATEAALIRYQEQYMLGLDGNGTGDTWGVCGPNTWAGLEAQFGDLDGLRSEEDVEVYVDETYEDAVLSDKSPDELLAALAAAANERLAAAGVPYVPYKFGDEQPNWGAFRWWDWEVTIDRQHFLAARDENNPETYNPVYNMDTAYHEARHAEQWWQVARALAGAYDLDGPGIHAETDLHPDIANLAAADPLRTGDATATAALTWYEHKMKLTSPASGVDSSNELDAAGAGGGVQRQVDENDWGPAAGRQLLRLGHGNPGEIRYLQELLVYRNFHPGEPDSAFGPRTEAAVKAFQASRGLDDDGIVGRRTWEALLP
jgi:peptidoglycan hydrolase-like protein with peptidoglycan-binding domain